MVAAGLLTVTHDPRAAVLASDVSIVCVGTPSARGGGLATAYLEKVSDEIGAALAEKSGWHTVVYRSTMLPGTCEEVLIPSLERSSGKRVGVDFGVCVNPEFLREGTSVADFFEPAKTVVGQSDTRSGDVVTDLYDGLPGPRFRVALGVAEMAKYVDNCFHALKVDFGNEIGAICGALGLDSHAVMDLFLADTKLNLSAAYLRPGFAFGGSCLPKDVRALTHAARRHDVEVPVLSHVLSSNEAHLRRVVDTVLGLGKRRVGIFGLSFKAGTDDLRESPLVELSEQLIGKGCEVRIYDPNVSLSRLLGANKAHIEERLPHLADLLVDDARLWPTTVRSSSSARVTKPCSPRSPSVGRHGAARPGAAARGRGAASAERLHRHQLVAMATGVAAGSQFAAAVAPDCQCVLDSGERPLRCRRWSDTARGTLCWRVDVRLLARA